MMEQERLTYLFQRCYNQTATTEEREEFLELVALPQYEKPLNELLESTFATSISTNEPGEEVSRQILSAIFTTKEERKNKKQIHRIHFLKTTWFRYAASIIIMATGLTIWYIQHNHSKSFNPLNPSSRQLATITPTHDRAILTLASGQQILLDSTQGSIINQDGLRVVNHTGKLNYEGIGSKLEYHTLSTPRGGQYKLMLPDGTVVWLNAASSITYPTVFTNKERTVSITGEAYFEVSKDAHKPFTVKTYKDEIVVLGTSFNINSYRDESVIKTALLQGAIQVNGRLLKPGEAYINGEIVHTDLEQELAWKKGLFSFNKADVTTVMKQLARWYDIEVLYEGKIPDMEFNGEIGRDLTLAEVLKGLAKTKVNYRMEGNNKIVIFK